MPDNRGRRPAHGRRPTRSPIERPLELDGWVPSAFDEIHVGDLITLKLMAAFDAGDGTPRMSHAPGKPSFAMRAGIGFVARVVGEDLDHDGALLIERTAWSHEPDRRVILPPALMSLSRRDLDRRGAWTYRHRDEGPADRLGRTGTKLLHDRLLRAAGGGVDDEIVVDRVAGCLSPETTAGVKPGHVGRIRAGMMLRGEAAFSEVVCNQLLAMPPIVRPTPQASNPKASRSSTRKAKAEDAEDTTPQLLNEPTRDAILSLRWEMKDHWELLREAVPGISKTGAAVAIAAWQENKTGGRSISYSRTATHYEGRDASPLYTYEKVKTGVDALDKAGLLSDHFRQVAGGRGTQSSFRGSDELVEIVDGILGPKPRLVPRRPGLAVLMRDAAGASMQLPDTRAFHRQVQRVEGTNEHVRAADLSHGVGACYTRIYHETIRRGGRWYADGMSWQNLKKEVRSTIRIDDEATVELDYVTAHAAMIYADAGVPLPEDAYATPGWPRKLAKVAFLTMINAKTRKAAVYSLAYGSLIAMAGVIPGTQAAIDKAADLVDDVVVAHMPVATSFFSDAGAALMKRDADIAANVMWGLLRAGVTTLGVHDSFIVKASEADKLRAAMEEAANDAGVPSMRVGVA